MPPHSSKFLFLFSFQFPLFSCLFKFLSFQFFSLFLSFSLNLLNCRFFLSLQLSFQLCLFLVFLLQQSKGIITCHHTSSSRCFTLSFCFFDTMVGVRNSLIAENFHLEGVELSEGDMDGTPDDTAEGLAS